MRPRHLLGVAVLSGVVGTLGGPTAQAAPPNSVKFVKLLLKNETKAIKSDTKALNTRDKDIAKLQNTTNRRVENQLEKSLTTLHRQILSMTTRLSAGAMQTYTAASILSPPDPPLKSSALSNLLVIQTLSVRAGLGISPATPNQ
jgi:hypothetical protein